MVDTHRPESLSAPGFSLVGKRGKVVVFPGLLPCAVPFTVAYFMFNRWLLLTKHCLTELLNNPTE